MYNYKKQSGFTLVEIAIVLVIIGLLLGGILKGQELINSARVRNLADQNSGVQAAYYGFIDRYRQVPGDWTTAAATTAIGVTVYVGGNGNGRIDNAYDEAVAVWEQLAKSGFLGGGFTPADTTYVTGETGATGYAAFAPVNAFNGSLTLTRNADYLGTASTRLNLHVGNNIPVSISRELDVKVDDSKPLTGVLRLTIATAPTIFPALHLLNGASTTCADLVNNEYDIAADQQDCGQVFLY